MAECVGRKLFAGWIWCYGYRYGLRPNKEPESNGMLDRRHRRTLSPISCNFLSRKQLMVDMLPIILGIRAVWKEDLGATVDVYAFRAFVNIPIVAVKYHRTYEKLFADLSSIPAVRHFQRKTFIFKELAPYSLLVRHGAPHYSFTSPNEGPYRVVSCPIIRYSDRSSRSTILNRTVTKLNIKYIVSC